VRPLAAIAAAALRQRLLLAVEGAERTCAPAPHPEHQTCHGSASGRCPTAALSVPGAQPAQPSLLESSTPRRGGLAAASFAKAPRRQSPAHALAASSLPHCAVEQRLEDQAEPAPHAMHVGSVPCCSTSTSSSDSSTSSACFSAALAAKSLTRSCGSATSSLKGIGCVGRDDEAHRDQEEEKEEDDEDEHLCKVCFARPEQVVPSTCRHALCAACAGELVHAMSAKPLLCPFCRTAVADFARKAA
jgi:hypothetical protein